MKDHFTVRVEPYFFRCSMW